MQTITLHRTKCASRRNLFGVGPPGNRTAIAASTLGLARLCFFTSEISAFLSHGLRRGAPGIAAGEQAAAEKRAFQRAVAVHAAAAKAACFAGGIKTRHGLAVPAEHTRAEIGLAAAQRLAGQDVEFYRDQRTM